MEILALLGKRREVIQAAEDLRGIKGVAFGDYSLTSPSIIGGRTGHRHPHAGPGPPRNRARGR